LFVIFYQYFLKVKNAIKIYKKVNGAKYYSLKDIINPISLSIIHKPALEIYLRIISKIFLATLVLIRQMFQYHQVKIYFEYQ